MLKNKFKIIAVLLTIITVISSFSIIVKATDGTPVVTSDEPDTSSETNEISDNTSLVQPRTDENENLANNILYEDLYIFDNSVTMDKIVDGNVYIFGNNVKITGKVNGNLFVFANEVTFEPQAEAENNEEQNDNYCYIAGSVYAFAEKISFNAITNDIYAACENFKMSYDSYIMRDIRIFASDITLKGYITRNAYLYSDKIDLGTKSDNEEMNDAALISGDLKYYANSEISIPEGTVVGEVSYNSTAKIDKNSNGKNIIDYVMDLLNVIIYTFIMYLILKWLMPKFFEKTSDELKTSTLLTFGIGLISLIVVPVVAFILLCLTLLSLSATLLTVYGILIAISFTVLATTLTYLLKDKFGFANKKLLLLLIVTIILWALKQIPFVGPVITIIISTFGLGLITKIIIDRKKIENK